MAQKSNDIMPALKMSAPDLDNTSSIPGNKEVRV